MPRKRALGRLASPTPPGETDEVVLDIQGRQVKCTRLGKILYPQSRTTKADVIDYYVRVAPFILPHLKNRPVTLKRSPDGAAGEASGKRPIICTLIPRPR